MFNGYEWMTRVLEVRPDRMGAVPASDDSVVGGSGVGVGVGLSACGAPLVSRSRPSGPPWLEPGAGQAGAGQRSSRSRLVSC